MKLHEYLDGLRAATTASELEDALKAPFKHAYIGRTWNKICEVRIAAGNAICDRHPHGQFVPRIGERRRLTLCGEQYRVASGGNSTGVRYAWHAAEQWAKAILYRHGFSKRAAASIWSWTGQYPHRCLPVIEAALAGKLSDPPMDRLIRVRWSAGPVRCEKAENDVDPFKRASRPCGCGGTRFDWGAGTSHDVDFINWHCNRCSRVYVEFLSQGRLVALRNPSRATPRGSAVEVRE